MFLIQVLTDHKNLQYFMSMKQLTHHQTHWAEYLSQFDFKIIYQSGKLNQKSDMLTWQSQDLSTNFSDKQIANQLWILLSSECFEKIQLIFANNDLNNTNLSVNVDKWNMDFEDLMNHKYIQDSWITEVMKTIQTDQWQHKNITLAECKL